MTFHLSVTFVVVIALLLIINLQELRYEMKVNVKNDSIETLETSQFQRVLPQVIASIVKNFLILGVGLSAAFPTIVIPALRGLNKLNNPNEIVTLTAAQASWLGSTAYLTKLCGSILAGWITEPIGRKKAMIIVNIPHLIAYAIMYNSTTLTEVFIADIFHGFGVGLMETPAITYAAEICEPSVRGILSATSGISSTLGFFIVFLLGSLTKWRNAALFCSSVPLLTMIAISFIPETPMWLLSKNREAEALKSLRWLRGWVSEEAVQNEFEEIKRYRENSKACSTCEKAKLNCLHPTPPFKEKLKELVRKKTLKPFFILMIAVFLGQFCGSVHLSPYIVQILHSYRTPICPNLATVIVGATGICASVTCVVIIRLIGKRKIHLVALSGVCFSNTALGIYGFVYFTPGYSSFKDNSSSDEIKQSVFPLIMFVMLRFFSSGISIVPFMMLSELFPFKLELFGSHLYSSRGLGTGITSGAGYVFAFIATKTFYNLENLFSLQGVMCFYGGLGLIGLITAYNIVPETENRTLEDIEIHFSDNQRKIYDRKIQKNATISSFNESNVIKY